MCDSDATMASVYTETRPRARKEHRCVECRLPIPVGVRYVRTWGIWDGEASSYAQHIECRELLEFISERYCGGETWTYGSLREEVSEYTDDGNYYGEALACRMSAIEARYDR